MRYTGRDNGLAIAGRRGQGRPSQLLITEEAAAAALGAVVTASVDMVELLSAFVVVDCIEEVDTAEDVSMSTAFVSQVDEVTCCLGDIEKRALCADEDEDGTPAGEAVELTGFDSCPSVAAEEVDGPASMPESNCS